MSLVPETRLRATLREDSGGTDSVNAGHAKVPAQRCDLGISFGCAPDRTAELLKAVRAEIDLPRSSGPTPQQVSDAKIALVREFETNSRQNACLLNRISLRHQHGEDLGQLFGLAGYDERAVAAAAIQQAARRRLDLDNCIQVTLLPEQVGQARSGLDARA
ncbi:MAG TPA: insulinase family protein [Vicinamibacterales bacterium]|nr:insulinase family protein [Vicinamibacterales bacterium]